MVFPKVFSSFIRRFKAFFPKFKNKSRKKFRSHVPKMGTYGSKRLTGSANCSWTQYLSPDGAIYVMNHFGTGWNRTRVSRLGGEIASHNTTDVRQNIIDINKHEWCKTLWCIIKLLETLATLLLMVTLLYQVWTDWVWPVPEVWIFCLLIWGLTQDFSLDSNRHVWKTLKTTSIWSIK